MYIRYRRRASCHATGQKTLLLLNFCLETKCPHDQAPRPLQSSIELLIRSSMPRSMEHDYYQTKSDSLVQSHIRIRKKGISPVKNIYIYV